MPRRERGGRHRASTEGGDRWRDDDDDRAGTRVQRPRRAGGQGRGSLRGRGTRPPDRARSPRRHPLHRGRAPSRSPSRTRGGSSTAATPPCSRGESAAITAGWRKARWARCRSDGASMIVCGALVVRADLERLHAPGARGQAGGLDYGNGTAYAGLLMLEGAMPREAITTLRGRHAARRAPRRAACAATSRRRSSRSHGSPWPRRPGCRLVSTTFFHGTWVADPSLDPEAYAAFLRAITRAVRRINADKRRYVSYFIRDWAGRSRGPGAHARRLQPRPHPAQGAGPDPGGRGALGLGVDGELGRDRRHVRRHRPDQSQGRA